MFSTNPIPNTSSVNFEWQVPQQPGMVPIAQLLEEAKRTNALLTGIWALLAHGPDVHTARMERLEQQVAKLMEKL